MTPTQELELIRKMHVKHPHMRISNVMHYVEKRKLVEELQRPTNKQKGVVAMIRKLTGKA